MDSKNYTQVLIDGKIYTLGGSEDEAYLQKAASYVNEKNAQMRRIPGFSKQNADYQMVMTQLNIADDYFKALEWAEGMERQKNDMEKETYSLKHELVSTQMKLEAVLKDLEERQKELDRLASASAQLEGELREAREELEDMRSSRIIHTEDISAQETARQSIRTESVLKPDASAKAKTISVIEDVLKLEAIPDTANSAQAQDSVHESAGEESEGEGTGAAEAAAALQPTGISDTELARKALKAAKKANSHRGGRR